VRRFTGGKQLLEVELWDSYLTLKLLLVENVKYLLFTEQMNQGNGAQTEEKSLNTAEKEEEIHRNHISRYRRCLGKNISGKQYGI
jgi:hypothetical protein